MKISLHQEVKLQKKLLKIVKLLNEMSALLPPDVKVVCGLNSIYQGVREFSDKMIKYGEKIQNATQ